MPVTPIKRKSWLFTLQEDAIFHTQLLNREFENQWMKLTPDGLLIIRKGYSWDGCSPKFNLLDTWLIGTPDGNLDSSTGKPNTYYASCLHDVLYQFGVFIGLGRKQVDLEFKHFLGTHKAAWVYYYVVRSLGWLFFH